MLAGEAGGASPEYIAQMNSESKRPIISKVTKKTVERWAKIGSRANHLWDCEAMQIAAALMLGILSGLEVETADAADSDKPETPA